MSPPRLDRHPLASLLVVLGSVAAVVGLRAVLSPVLGNNSPLVLLLLPVVVSSWYGGLWPGLLATMVGVVAGMVLFVPPVPEGVSPLAHWLGRSVPFVCVGAAISLFAQLMHRARGESFRHAGALHESEELRRQAFDAAKDYSIFTTQPDGTITSWNTGAERLFGYARADAVGRNASMLFTPEDRAADAPAKELGTALATGRAGDERWHLRKDGSRFFANGTVRSLHDAAGTATGLVKIARDATAEHDARAGMEEVRRRTEAALLAGEVGTYYWDVQNDRVYGDRNFVALFGVLLNEHESAPLAEMVAAIHPDDRGRVAERIKYTLDTDQPFSEEYRVIVDGDARWVVAHGTVERDDKGTPVGWPGVIVDINAAKDAERRLRESEEQFRTLFESMDQGYCIIEMIYDAAGRPCDYRYLIVNPAFEKHVKLPDVVGRTIRELVPGHDAHWFETYGRVAETGEPMRFVGDASAMGQIFDLYAFRVGGPGSRQVAVLFTDVTEQRRQEAQLKASEERYRTLFTTIDEGFCVLDMIYDESGRAIDYVHAEYNPAFERHTGLRDCAGRRVYQMLPDLEPHWLATYAGVADTGRTTHFTNHARGLDDRWFDVTAFRIGEPGRWRVAVLFKDITARRRIEMQLEKTHRRVEAALIAGDIGVYDWDIPADRFYGDANFVRMFGMTPDADGTLPINAWASAIHPDDQGRVMSDFAEVLARAGRFEAEYRVGRGEQVRWLASRGQFEDNAGRPPERLIGTVIDITDRKQAEAELTATARQRDALIDLQRAVTAELGGGAAEVAVLTNVAGRVLQVMPAAEGSAVELIAGEGADEHLEYVAAAGLLADSVGATVKRAGSLSGACLDLGIPLVCDDALVDPRVDRPACVALGIRAMLVVPLQRGGRFVGVLKFASGRPTTFGESDVLAAQLAVGAIATGLSGAGEAQAVEALTRSESRFRTIADAMPQIVWVTRPDGFHEYYNRRWYEYVGTRPGESDGDRWGDPLHPDDGERSRVRWQRSLDTGEPYEVEYRFRRHDGVYRWFLGRALAVRDDRGRIINWYGTCTDIDEQKRLEAQYDAVLESERHARTQAEQAGRMKDEFLATISHELRTPLTAIVGWSHLMTPTSDVETLTEGLAVIHRNAQAQSQLIEDILDVSRITSGRLRLRTKTTRLIEPIEAAVATVRTAADAKGVAVNVEADRALTLVADGERLQQVFWNLLANAIKFTDSGGRVTLRATTGDDYVTVEVADTGRGISPDFLPFVFDRFRQADMTTTRRHGGLGLGLAIVRHLVELHGGRVSADSPGDGRGSTFRVTLPRTNPAASEPPAPANPLVSPLNGPAAALAGRRVLILDDEPDTRRVMEAVLRRQGADSVAVDTVAAALSTLDTAGPFDAVLSDIGLPHEDGYVFINRLRSREKDRGDKRLPAVAMTAYTRPSDRLSVLSAGFDRYLPKPIDPAELLSTLGDVIAPAVRPRT